MTAHGDRELNNFKDEYCDFFDGMDYYLENYSVERSGSNVVQGLVEAKNRMMQP